MRVFRFFLPLLLWLTAVSANGFGQAFIYQKTFNPTPCDVAASKKQGSFRQVTDDLANDWDGRFEPGMAPWVNRMMAIVKQGFPGPVGFDGEFQRGMAKGQFIADGPRKYLLTTIFFPFGCVYNLDPATKKSVPTGNFSRGSETDTWLYLYVNNPASFLHGEGTVQVDGKSHKVYSTQPAIGTWKGYMLYGDREFLNGEAWSTTGNVWVLIARKGEEPFMPISRRQYLHGILEEYDAQYATDSAGSARGTDPQQGAAILKRYTDKYTANRANVQHYLDTAPPDSLQLPAVLYGRRDDEECGSWFTATGKRQILPRQFLIANHAYWRTGADKAAPQLIVLRFRYDEGSWESTQVKKQFQESFPVDALRDLIAP